MEPASKVKFAMTEKILNLTTTTQQNKLKRKRKLMNDLKGHTSIFWWFKDNFLSIIEL